MTEVEMGPSVAVALRHGHGTALQPLAKDNFSMVYMPSAPPVTSKAVGNHNENHCTCISNAACFEEADTVLVAESGSAGTLAKFKHGGLQNGAIERLDSVSKCSQVSFVDASRSDGGLMDLGQCHLDDHSHFALHDANGQGSNMKIYDDSASQYGNGRRKRVKAADLEESVSADTGQQLAVDAFDASGAATLSVETCEVAEHGSCAKNLVAEKQKWRNDARHPETRRRRWAQADPLLDLWKAVSASKYAAPFRRPVALMEEYDAVVRQRMDLSTIRRRLENGSAYSIMELQRDLMLMLTNALRCLSSFTPTHTFFRVSWKWEPGIEVHPSTPVEPSRRPSKLIPVGFAIFSGLDTRNVRQRWINFISMCQVYSKHGSEAFQMALKLKQHVTKLFKELSSAKQKQRPPITEDVYKPGSKAAKSAKQLPQSRLPPDFYNSLGSIESTSSASRHRDGSQKQQIYGDLPTAPFKKQRTSRKPRPRNSMDSIGFWRESAVSMGIDSSSEEEVAAMLICIRSGQGFYGERDKHAGSSAGVVQFSGCKLSSDYASLALSKHSKYLHAASLWKSVTANQTEHALCQEVEPRYYNRAEPSVCVGDLAAIRRAPFCSQQSTIKCNGRPIKKTDMVRIATTPGFVGDCMESFEFSCPERLLRSGYREQNFSSYNGTLSEEFKQECSSASKERTCGRPAGIMDESELPSAAIIDGMGATAPDRVVETSASTISTDRTQGNQMELHRSIFDLSHPCSSGVVLGGVRTEESVDMKNDQVSDLRSEKNCMGLKHKWQQRWQMQSAALCEEISSLCGTNKPACESVTVTLGHCDQVCDQEIEQTVSSLNAKESGQVWKFREHLND